MGVSAGRLYFIFMRLSDWDLSRGRWFYQKHYDSSIWNTPIVSNGFLGFGFQREAGPGEGSATIIEFPMWALALLSISPLIWLYLRHRKRRKIGFPVAAVAANSTESTPARMG
jgi:hypothetical protein